MMVWLAPGLNDGDSHECRSCGLSYVVRTPNEKLDILSRELLSEN